MQSASLGHGNRRRTQVLQKETPQVPRTDAQAARQLVDSAIIEGALTNQAQSARDGAGCSGPRGCSRRHFRPAAQARTKSGFRCSRGGREVDNVPFFRWMNGTDRPAIDAGAGYGDEKSAVEPGIARMSRAPPNLLLSHAPD